MCEYSVSPVRYNSVTLLKLIPPYKMEFHPKLTVMVQCSSNSGKIALISILLEDLALTTAHISISPIVLTNQGISNISS